MLCQTQLPSLRIFLFYYVSQNCQRLIAVSREIVQQSFINDRFNILVTKTKETTTIYMQEYTKIDPPNNNKQQSKKQVHPLDYRISATLKN